MCNIHCLKKGYLLKRVMEKAHEIDSLAYKRVVCKLLNKIDTPLCTVHCKHMFWKEHVDNSVCY